MVSSVSATAGICIPSGVQEGGSGGLHVGKRDGGQRLAYGVVHRVPAFMHGAEDGAVTAATVHAGGKRDGAVQGFDDLGDGDVCQGAGEAITAMSATMGGDEVGLGKRFRTLATVGSGMPVAWAMPGPVWMALVCARRTRTTTA